MRPRRNPRTVTPVAISIDDLALAAAPGWRACEEDRLGDWLLRAAEGFTGRANSALAAGDPGLPLTAVTPASMAAVIRSPSVSCST